MIAIIEMPQGCILKYEVNKEDGSLMVDRMLNQPVPYNYGYFPGTLQNDGDPLDVFVIGNIPIHPLTKVRVELIGVLKCMDNGVEDDKILAIIEGDETGSRHIGTDIVRSYLTSYKKGFEILEMGDSEEAHRIYNESLDQYVTSLFPTGTDFLNGV